MLSITVATEALLESVRALYRECGYGGGVSEDDAALVAHVDGHLVAAVRVCSEHGVTVLRGMQVRPAYQRRGIGGKLLEACLPLLNHNTSYCLPYMHLTSFCGVVGFVVAEQSKVPRFLARRAAAYVESGRSVFVMQRAAPNRVAGGL